MKKKDRRELGKYCRAIADAIELRDWFIWLEVDEPTDPGRPDGQRWQATSQSTPGQKRVTLTFAPDIRDWSRETIRQTVIHELVHAHFAPLVDCIRTDLGGHLKPKEHKLFDDNTTRWLEFGVDAMADALAKHLPLIDWPS